MWLKYKVYMQDFCTQKNTNNFWVLKKIKIFFQISDS